MTMCLFVIIIFFQIVLFVSKKIDLFIINQIFTLLQNLHANTHTYAHNIWY